MTNNQAQQTLSYLSTIIGDLNQIQSNLMTVNSSVVSGANDVETSVLNTANLLDSWMNNFAAKYYPLMFVVIIIMTIVIIRRQR